MPYISCPGCRLTVYSAAAHSTVEHCPRCGERLSIEHAHLLHDAERLACSFHPAVAPSEEEAVHGPR